MVDEGGKGCLSMPEVGKRQREMGVKARAFLSTILARAATEQLAM